MPRPSAQLVIDARPRGPVGPLASEYLLGQSLLGHMIELASSVDSEPIVVHARLEEHRRLQALVPEHAAVKVVFLPGPPPEGAAILRTDRLYDAGRLRRVLRRSRDPETAVIWRIDTPRGLEGAEAELIRRQSYQPLGRYWALFPARLLARCLVATRVRPNALTLAAGVLMLGAAAAVAFAPVVVLSRVAIAAALALALVLDTADGHLARLQGSASAFGRWLDAWLDELCDMSLHAAIAWAAFAQAHAPVWLVLGMTYGMGKYLFFMGDFLARQEPAGDAGKTAVARRPGHASRWREGLLNGVRLAGHADLRWHLWIVLAALGRLELALAAYALYFPARALAGAVRKGATHG